MGESSTLWDDYEAIIAEFENRKLNAISNHSIAAKKRVNGLTDGWYEFLNELAQAKKMWNSQFDGDIKIKYDEIVASITNALENRK